MSEIDVRALRYFSAVAQAGSYSRAALNLDISQPAVSRQVLLLERALKTRLFRRESRGFTLTETGIALYEKAQRILGEVDSLSETVGAAARAPQGRLGLGVSVATGEYLMPGVMQRYRGKYPNVTVHLVQSYTSDLANLLIGGKLDIALLYGTQRHADLELSGLMDLDMGLVLPPGKGNWPADTKANRRGITIREMAGVPLICPAPGADLRRVVQDAFLTHNLAPDIVMEVDGISLAKALVGAGIGCTVLAYNAVHSEVQAGALRFMPIVNPALQWRLCMAVRRAKPETPAMRAMTAEIQAALQRGVCDGTWRGRLVGADDA